MLKIEVRAMERDLKTVVFSPDIPPEQQIQKEAFQHFVAYMNEMADRIGMKKSHFHDAAGMDNLTTARDLLHLMAYAVKNPVLQKIWNQNQHTVTVEGNTPRTQLCQSKSRHSDLDDAYRVVVRKGGSLRSSRCNLYVYNLATILEIPNSPDLLAVVVMYAPDDNESPNNRFRATRQVADIAIARYEDPNADISRMPVCCENAIAAVLPADGSAARILYEKDADAQGRPMSISKVLTAVCVLEQVKDLAEKITYDVFDTNIGGFYARDFLPGDEMTYLDAMYALMLESSNVTAQALARLVGQRL